MGPVRCPKCQSMTASYDPRIGRLRCYRNDCDWKGPDEFMYRCLVCHSQDLSPDFTLFDEQCRPHEGCYCKHCGIRLYHPMWKGEK